MAVDISGESTILLLAVSSSIISRCSAFAVSEVAYGGAIDFDVSEGSDAAIIISDSIIASCSAIAGTTAAGGALHMYVSVPNFDAVLEAAFIRSTVTTCWVEAGTGGAATGGGAVAFVPFKSDVRASLSDSTIAFCRAISRTTGAHGGGLWSFGASILLTDSTELRDCSAEVRCRVQSI